MPREGGGAGGRRGIWVGANGGALTAARRDSAEEKELNVLSLDDSGEEDWGATLPGPAASGVRRGGGEAARPFAASLGPAGGRLREEPDAGLEVGGQGAHDSSEEGSDEGDADDYGDSDESVYDDDEEEDLPYLETAPPFERGMDARGTRGCASIRGACCGANVFCVPSPSTVLFASPQASLPDEAPLCAAVLRAADAGESAVKITAGLLVSGARAAGRGASLGVGLGMNAIAVERDRGSGAMGTAQQVSRLCWVQLCELPRQVLPRCAGDHLPTSLTLSASPTRIPGCHACLAGIFVRIFASAAERRRARSHSRPKGLG